MKKTILLVLSFIYFTASFAQNSILYTLNHILNSDKITIEIELDSIISGRVKLIIPRSGPGTYELTNYLAFVDNVRGQSISGEALTGIIGDGSYFIFNEKEEFLKKISYEVDLRKMETNLLGSFSSSKSRDNYLGLLGYSVFGFVEGLQNKPITLEIKTHLNWPIFSTLRPSLNRKYGKDKYEVENYALLADGQYLLGSAVQVFQVKEAKIPLFVAAYAETSISLEEIGRRGLIALQGLADYFGYIPMPHYTMCYEFLKPISESHDYGFNMEHLNSMSSSRDISKAITSYNPKARIGAIVHHMAHSWLPLRSYGTGYRPFEWQTAPLIETIWLNEGFIWYVSFYYVLNNKNVLKFFNNIIDTAPNYIQQKSLKELSLLGSTQYGLDFRIGKNLFSRGALLAHDLDVLIRKETDDQKSFKEAILGLLKWTEMHNRAFEYNEIEPVMSKATDVDLSAIWKKWQKPIKK